MDRGDNLLPREIVESRFKLFKKKTESNPMRDAREEEEQAAKERAAKDGAEAQTDTESAEEAAEEKTEAEAPRAED